MQIFETSTLKGSKIWIWKMEEDTESTAIEAGCDQSEDYQKLKSKRRREWAHIRHLLKLHYPTSRIAYTEEGRPYLENDTKSISIAHTGDFACIMVNTTGSPVGIDIEKRSVGKDGTAKVLRVAPKFMVPEELALKPTDDDALNALLAWTTKEALYKIGGKHLWDFQEAIRITEINISGNEGNGKVLDIAKNISYDIEFRIWDDFVMASIG
ncbi:MAG: 4'-phosphopantetheinyl transferase superfamily protein [Paludibacteraceae bacterium]|nr:4'-phosphopantetheinyl transferase superfamily protein [Paludibacteraceae bacterium]